MFTLVLFASHHTLDHSQDELGLSRSYKTAEESPICPPPPPCQSSHILSSCPLMPRVPASDQFGGPVLDSLWYVSLSFVPDVEQVLNRREALLLRMYLPSSAGTSCPSHKPKLNSWCSLVIHVAVIQLSGILSLI